MDRNRFTSSSLSEQAVANNSPIYGYQHLPVPTLEEAVEKIPNLVPYMTRYVDDAKKKCNRSSNLLTIDESAAIYLYTMSGPLFNCLNTTLRSENRHALKPWFYFLKLFLDALEKLSSTSDTVWRGVNYDDTLTFVDNSEYIWWGVNSCSMNARAVQLFLGETGTLFAIHTIHGKNISEFSAFPEEQEVILMPGTQVRAKSESLNFLDSFFLIHLEQVTRQK